MSYGQIAQLAEIKAEIRKARALQAGPPGPQAANACVGEKARKKSHSRRQSQRWVYPFGGGKAAGKAGMRNLLGGKGAGLAEMANLGLPVPPGFTITTEVCTYYYANEQQLSGRRSKRR